MPDKFTVLRVGVWEIDVIPPIALTFYSFHIMVALGMWFTILFAILIYFLLKKDSCAILAC